MVDPVGPDPFVQHGQAEIGGHVPLAFSAALGGQNELPSATADVQEIASRGVDGPSQVPTPGGIATQAQQAVHSVVDARDAGERRRDPGLGQPRARQVELSLGDLERRGGIVEILRRPGPLVDDVAGALVRGLLLVADGLGGVDAPLADPA